MELMELVRSSVGWGGIAVLGVLAFPGVFALILWLRGRAPTAPQTASEPPRLVFLVPAHNERLLIGPCVRSLLAQAYPRDRLRVVVIADNCEDETAAIAREAGAEVFERTDTVRRGKPYALAWTIERIGTGAADAFVVIDADSEVPADYAAQIAASGPVRPGALQTYFGISNEYETWLTRLSGLLMRLRYEVQFPAKARAGINVPLTGNGMVLGAELLERRPWRAFSVTEDWELYAEYTARGERIGYVPAARLISQEARSTSQSATQRVRWQAGRLAVRRAWGPEVRTSRVISFAQKVDVHIELYWPSPAVHVSLAMVGAAVALAGGVGLSLVVAAFAAAIGETAVRVAVIVARHPQPGPTIRALVWAPFYAVWRLGIGVRARFSRRARGEWVRTARHEHQ